MMKSHNKKKSGPKECPVCGMINPHSAQRCDCGYDFTDKIMKESYLNPEEVPDDVKAMADLNEELEIEEIQSITEKDKLIEIIKTDKREHICRTAIDQMNDTDVLLDLLKNEKRINIRRKLLSVLPENLVPDNFKEDKQKIEAQKKKIISDYTRANPKLGFLNWGFSGAFYFGGAGEKLPGQFLGSVRAALFFIGVIKPIFSKTVNPAVFFVFLIAAIISFTIGYSQYSDEYEKKINRIRDSAL